MYIFWGNSQEITIKKLKGVDRLLTLLLSLVPPSCMVAPIRDLVNTLFSTMPSTLQASQLSQLPFIMNMNVDTNIVRGRFASFSKNSSRELSITFQASSMAYHERMGVMNNLLSKNGWNPINSSQLSYASNNGEVEKSKLVSEVTDNSPQRKTPHFVNEAPALNNTLLPWREDVAKDSSNTSPLQEVINIQLP